VPKSILPLAVLAGLLIGAPLQADEQADVRIMARLPAKECEYKVQEICKYDNWKCFAWYKKRAANYQANVVVMPVGSFALADYYQCPANEAEKPVK